MQGTKQRFVLHGTLEHEPCDSKYEPCKAQNNNHNGYITLWPCPFTFKGILKGKRRIMKTQIFHPKKYNLQKIP
jgi:hypothetical protein